MLDYLYWPRKLDHPALLGGWWTGKQDFRIQIWLRQAACLMGVHGDAGNVGKDATCFVGMYGDAWGCRQGCSMPCGNAWKCGVPFRDAWGCGIPHGIAWECGMPHRITWVCRQGALGCLGNIQTFWSSTSACGAGLCNRHAAGLCARRFSMHCSGGPNRSNGWVLMVLEKWFEVFSTGVSSQVRIHWPAACAGFVANLWQHWWVCNTQSWGKGA
eukprot:1137778-Pelagomonas_calceolata.AAC.3